ncbi:MAG: hypothetical protein DLM58_08175 [Pseudonocardiales bacterium]|nr:MAG: hypothetical protein DLM58_08175 [Pseudonocardiales bacterium]
MRIRMLAKDASSGTSGCPSVYLAENGELVVQGFAVDDDTRGRLQNVLPGESAVRINADVVFSALARWQSER